MLRFINTFGFVGLMRPAPGTWGSLAAVLIGWRYARAPAATVPAPAA